jgi:hypothetical protein
MAKIIPLKQILDSIFKAIDGQKFVRFLDQNQANLSVFLSIPDTFYTGDKKRRGLLSPRFLLKTLVGARGFEPPTP